MNCQFICIQIYFPKGSDFWKVFNQSNTHTFYLLNYALIFCKVVPNGFFKKRNIYPLRAEMINNVFELWKIFCAWSWNCFCSFCFVIHMQEQIIAHINHCNLREKNLQLEFWYVVVLLYLFLINLFFQHLWRGLNLKGAWKNRSYLDLTDILTKMFFISNYGTM